jgi:preprotein translocase subunit SecG
MYAVLLTIEVVVCIAMIGVILLQRSEGGGLGLGSGGGMSGLMTGRGAANVLTRTTVILATIFISTSIALTLMAKATRTQHPLGDVAPAAAPLGTLPTTTPSRSIDSVGAGPAVRGWPVASRSLTRNSGGLPTSYRTASTSSSAVGDCTA